MDNILPKSPVLIRSEFAGELEERFGQQSSGGQAICSTEEEAEEAISRTLEEGWDGVFVKAEHGWAGQGNKRLRRSDTEECSRLFDFSVQLDVGVEKTEIASRSHATNGICNPARCVPLATTLPALLEVPMPLKTW
ncbi:hypothetical protein AK812_SmicGene14594 [Symbiodinium microadriaticum]|uniref:Uncharacterized protein n=1 Tax=Symbiodinium microadriaticum TaxID=2951 RepID=A0A1Q9E559_SYMMI|nr:hypothetical protein AK812_SmicGene14594 [Symbiodinium microadriaticum]